MNVFARIIIIFVYITSLVAAEKAVVLTSIARDAVLEELTGEKRFDRDVLIKRYPYLNEPGAAFVTLQKQRRLRGCIGSLQAYRPLIDDVIANAKAAAFRDSRFHPLKRSELESVDIEVSILSAPEAVPYRTVGELQEKIVPGRDGIILTRGPHRATFLPQVWEQMDDFEDFFHLLCRKAGLDAECLQLHPDIARYGVIRYDEYNVSKRSMANAGLFYPNSCAELESWFANTPAMPKRVKPSGRIKALIVPHAGYKFSGATADLVYRAAANSGAKHIVVLGPSHFISYKGISSAPVDALATPCGMVVNDTAVLTRLKKDFTPVYIPQVHDNEHSTEVQFPFVQHYFPYVPVTELVYGEVEPERLKAMVSRLLAMPDVLLIVSTDLSHYYDQERAHRKDFHCLDAVTAADPAPLRHCEACGKPGLQALLEAAREKGLKTQLIDYRTSADATGDTSRVVGYMSAVVYE
ncbi:MAG: AmmeMemoRadiSam system protein B [Campylobacterales bacterium]|nr:AmmeMemoRadiSam system protein B [Campylobacterales bacterium]